MSKNIFEHTRLTVTSYAGPANTLERTRMRLQFEQLADVRDQEHATAPITSLGFNDVVALYNALDAWIAEYRGDKQS